MNRPGQLLPAVETCLRRWLFSHFLVAFQKTSVRAPFFSPPGTQNRFFSWLPEVSVYADGGPVCVRDPPLPPPRTHRGSQSPRRRKWQEGARGRLAWAEVKPVSPPHL